MCLVFPVDLRKGKALIIKNRNVLIHHIWYDRVKREKDVLIGMNNKLMAVSVIVLACSITFAGIYIGLAIKETNAVNQQLPKEEVVKVESALLTQDQAAAYLNLEPAAFQQILTRQSGVHAKIENSEIVSYATYIFIPYIEIKGEKYFSRTEINKWIEYNMLNKGGHSEEILR